MPGVAAIMTDVVAEQTGANSQLYYTLHITFIDVLRNVLIRCYELIPAAIVPLCISDGCLGAYTPLFFSSNRQR